MKFGKLTIKNFGRTQYMEIDLSKSGLCQVIGRNEDTGQSNETGKTMTFNALSFCLYGKYPNMPKSVVNPLFSDEICELKLELIKNDNRFIFQREVQKSGSSYKQRLSIIQIGLPNNKFFEWDNITNKSIEKTNSDIAEFLGISYETFIRSHYLAQSGIKPFGEMTDSELKQYFLSDLLQIEWTKQSLGKVKEEEKNLNDKLIKIQTLYEMLDLKRKENEKTIKKLEKQKEIWTKEKEQTIQNIESKISEIERQKCDLLSKLNEIKEEINELESAPKESIKLKEQYETRKKELDKLDKEISNQQSIIFAYSEHILEIEREENDQMEEIGERCRLCGNIVKEDGLQYLNEDRKKRINELKKKIADLEQALESYRSKRTEMRSELNNDLSTITLLEDRENGSDRKLLSLKGYLTYNSTDNLDEQIKTLKENLDKQKREINPYQQQVDDLNNNIEKIDGQLDKAHSKEQHINNEMEKIQFWKTGFSSKGIQSFLLESITPTINERIKKYMDELSDNRIQVYFTTVTKLKNGEYRERFGLVVKNRDGGEGYGTLSGGAKARCNLACALALSDFQRQLTHNELEFLCLDEATASLDGYWEERFLEMIDKYYKQYPCFIISHKENLKNSLFNSRLVLVKRGGITYLEEQI